MALRKEAMGNNNERAEQKTKRSRITFDVSPELRRRIKSAALQEDISISEYLGRVLEETVPDEASTMQQRGHPATREAIERLRRLREQIAKENKGGPFEDSTELLRQQREERTRYLMGEL
jgi:predicted HicB family RNase H-like nuclease